VAKEWNKFKVCFYSSDSAKDRNGTDTNSNNKCSAELVFKGKYSFRYLFS